MDDFPPLMAVQCHETAFREISEWMLQSQRMLNMMSLEGGKTALTFCGVPIVIDNACPKNTILLAYEGTTPQTCEPVDVDNVEWTPYDTLDL